MKARNNKTLRLTTACDNEWTIIDEESAFDWEAFRAEAAKDILCAMLNTRYYDNAQRKQGCVEEAIYFANELIKELKEKEGK